MKFQIAFDLTDLDKALSIAQDIEKYVDVLEVGTLLIYKYGETAIKSFREQFPQKTILADAKIVDHSKDAAQIFLTAGADWITVLAGANKNVIHTASTIAHELGKKVMLDLVDSISIGQSALEAKSLGVDALLYHKPITEDSQLIFSERWEMVRGNTQLPIYITANISRENIVDILSIGAYGAVISKAIVNSQNPVEEAIYFSGILSNTD